MSTMQRLRAACLPFVTRSLRGGRLRRFALLSAVFGLLTLLVGSWLALGQGRFEREVREGLDLEMSRWERQRTEFVVIADDEAQHVWLQEERNRLRHRGLEALDSYGSMSNAMREAAATLVAATTVTAPPQHRELQRRAATLLETRGHVVLDQDPYMRDFNWHRAQDVAYVQAIVDQDLIPRVELYTSPLGVRGTLVVVGLVAGGSLILLLLVVAPLLAGVQIAQEVHENTLAPLTGTSLSPRQLVLGLMAGPLSVAGLLAIPQAAIFLSTAVLAGNAVPAIGMVVVGLAGCALLTMLTQLMGAALGRKRTPGLVGIGLLAMLSVATMIGLGLGLELNRDTAGLVTIAPHVGSFHLLRETFVPAARLDLTEAFGVDLRLVVGVVLCVCLAGIAVLAAERRVAGSPGPALRRSEAFAGATTIVLGSVLAVPMPGSDDAYVLATLALVTFPFLLLIMGRVPVGDVPAPLRKIPLRALMGEFACFVGLHVAIASIVVAAFGDGSDLLHFGPIAVFHLTWALAVAALAAIRATAIPVRLPGVAWLMFALLICVVAFGTGVAFVADAPHRVGDRHLFALSYLSPWLGAVQAVLTVVIPWSLIRAMRRGSGGLV